MDRKKGQMVFIPRTENSLKTAILRLLTPDEYTSSTSDMERDTAMFIVEQYRQKGFNLAEAFVAYEGDDSDLAIALLDLDVYGLGAPESKQDPLRLLLAGLCYELSDETLNESNLYLSAAAARGLSFAVVYMTGDTRLISSEDEQKLSVLSLEGFMPATVRLAHFYDLKKKKAAEQEKEKKRENGKETEKESEKEREKDRLQALQYWKRAADAGNVRGCLVIAKHLRASGQHDQAFPYWKRATEFGSDIGRLALAQCFLQGMGTAKEEKMAVHHFKKLLSVTDLELSFYAFAKLQLAKCYASGSGIAQDEKQAVVMYREVANSTKLKFNTQFKAIAGEALFLLSECYAKGRGVEKATNVSESIMEESAQLKYRPACVIMAALYTKKLKSTFDQVLRRIYQARVERYEAWGAGKK